jgi:stage II sporulation protein GA (sporulation sigma-E factor processing peptidase)
VVVYADLIFLLNACIDFLLLWLVAGIRRQKTSMLRIAAAAAAGGLYSMFQLWPEMSLAYFFPIKLAVSFVMVFIAYGFRHPVSFLRNLGVFYLVCFIAGGAMIAFHYVLTGDSQVAGGIFFTSSGRGWGSPVSWGMILAGFPLVWAYTRFSLKSLEEQRSLDQFLHPVRLEVEGKVLELTGLVDTGNQLRDPFSRAPVMMVELNQLTEKIPEALCRLALEQEKEEAWTKLPPNWMTRVRLIPYRAAGRNGDLLVAFRPDLVEIWEDGKWNNAGKILIGIDVGLLSSDGTYQAIIHPSCLSSGREWNGKRLEGANA